MGKLVKKLEHDWMLMEGNVRRGKRKGSRLQVNVNDGAQVYKVSLQNILGRSATYLSDPRIHIVP